MTVTAFNDLWQSDSPMIGTWCSIPSPYVVELIGSLGFDWICVDVQHGFIDEGALPSMLRAAEVAGVAALVRTRWNEPAGIMRALDAGAAGVIVPLVHTAAEAAQAAGACRYPPEGERSYGPMRPLVDGAPVGRDALCVVMVESVRAVDVVDEISSTAGVDAVFVGPGDLSLSAFGTRGSDVSALSARVASACAASGVVAGTTCSTGADAPAAFEAGFRLLTVDWDMGMLASGGRATLGAARAALAAERGVR
jgi:4-hydroxy-2-oxoheptanedioate aldolase